LARIETDIECLDRKLVDLKARRTRVLKGIEVEALAECAFRIAVHPSTVQGPGTEMLQLAMRTDPANPKYPYHMARLYFRAGDFENAGDWLNRARKLCPTSHRIWTHIGLLQREVNESRNQKYCGKKGYVQDEHKNRWNTISEGISNGSDQFDLLLAKFEPNLDQERPPGAPPQDSKSADQPAVKEPEEATERLTNAGVCRWTRIHDLTAEDLLEADAGSRTRDQMRSIMEWAADKAGSRPGGQALFCILAIEWILRGYSPEFIRRIRPRDLTGSAAHTLLDDVLDLIGTPLEAMPAALAAALDEKRIPALLAAAIHRQYVLGPPLNCGKLIADLCESRAVACNASAEDCDRWVRILAESAAVLERKPNTPIGDFPPETEKEEAGPNEILARVTQFLESTKQDAQSFREWLDERKSKQVETLSDEEILEGNRIQKFLNGLPSAVQQALGDLKRLRDSGNVQAFADAIQNLENGLQDINIRPLRVLLKRYPVANVPMAETPTPAPALAAAATVFAPPGVPSSSVALSPVESLASWITEVETMHKSMTDCRSRLQAMQKTPPGPSELAAAVGEVQNLLEAAGTRSAAILAEVKALRDSAKLGPTQAPEADRLEQLIQNLQPLVGPLRTLISRLVPAPTPADALALDTATISQDSRARLSAKIDEMEKRLIGLFDDQAQSFVAYSRSHSLEPALQAIRMSVTARKAEALYRLGRRGEARREWSALLKEDIFDLRLLRNLAIADTIEGHVQRYQASWRNYLEMLYFQAAALQDVTYLATEREAFHKNYGNAYGLKNLYEEKSRAEWAKPAAGTDLLAFVTSPARVRLYMFHQLLAIFNRRLRFRMAPLVLGVSRSAAEPSREEARQKMQAWSSTLCPLLPTRAASRFAETVSQALALALEGMKSHKRLRELAGRREYQEEKAEYLQWIADVFSWKIRLYNLLEELSKFSGQPGYLDLLAEFAEADSIPLDTSNELLQPVAMQLRQPPEVLCSLMERTCTNALMNVLQIVFPKHGIGEPGTEVQRGALYTRLTGELASTRLVAKTRQIIDNPGNVEVFEFYPPQIQEAIRSGKGQENDIRFLEKLHQQYPASGGITFHYALLLAHSNNLEEAKKVAAAGTSTAFHESSRKDCQDLLEKIL